MIHPQLLVAPVPSVSHMHYTSFHSSILFYTGMDDLFEVKMKLKSLNDWHSLGLALGLLYHTLERIGEEKQGAIEKCKTKMLATWLEKKDNVSKNGAPSWVVLQTALRKIDEKELADQIITS